MKRTLALVLPGGIALIGVALCCGLLWNQTAHFKKSVETIAEDVRVSLIDLKGDVVYDSAAQQLPNHAGRAEFEAVKADGKARTIVRESETLHMAMLYHARRVGDYILRIAVPYQAVTEAREQAIYGLVTAGGIGALVILLLYLMARQNETRIARLAAERDVQGRLLAEMRKLETFRRDFVSNVTHEIKTPLTGILGAVEILGDDDAKLDSSDRKELTKVLRDQSVRLNALAEDILSLAKLEQAETAPRTSFAACNLADIVKTAVNLAQPAAEKANTTLSTKLTDVERPCDARLIEEAVTNLINNALRYSGSPSVEVELSKREDGKAVISVIDHGIGIPKEAQARVFERFYRVDKARSRQLGGTGLGLAIVKHIALLHGGEVGLTSDPGSGCSFTLVI